MGRARSRPGRRIPVNRVSVAFFDHKSYADLSVGLENVRSTFSRKYQNIDSLPRPFVLGQPVMVFENRIVSKVEQVAPGVVDLVMPKDVDPKGVIRNNLLIGNKNRYVQDNEISYEKISITAK